MKIKVSELSGEALDWAVAKCKGLKYPYKVHGRGAVRATGYALIDESRIVTSYISPKTHIEWVKKCESYPWYDGQKIWNPSENWAQGGPIIDSMPGIQFFVRNESLKEEFQCAALSIKGNPVLNGGRISMNPYYGKTKLVAAMRCYIANRLGEEIKIPDELA